MKHFWTFLQLPSIHQLWQLLGNSSLDLQNKSTLWRKHCKPLEPAWPPAKWLIRVWNQSQCADNVEKTEGEKPWTARNDPFLLCRMFLPHFSFSKGWKMSTLGEFGRLKRRSSSLSTSSGLWLWKRPFWTYTKVLHFTQAEIQGLRSLRYPWKFLPLFYW